MDEKEKLKRYKKYYLKIKNKRKEILEEFGIPNLENDFEVCINIVDKVNSMNDWGEDGGDYHLLRQLLMQITEITELVEALRQEELKTDNIVEEIVDLLVRIFDFVGFVRYRLKDNKDGIYFNKEELQELKTKFKKIDFLSALLAKVQVNSEREKKHLKRF